MRMRVAALVVEIGVGVQRACPYPVDFTALGQDEAGLLRAYSVSECFLVEGNGIVALGDV